MPPSNPSTQGSNWYPTTSQLGDPAKLEIAFRQALNKIYELQNEVARLKGAAPPKPGPPPGSGPADSMLVGLFVAPVDTKSLANGATLKYNKANGNLEFS